MCQQITLGNKLKIYWKLVNAVLLVIFQGICLCDLIYTYGRGNIKTPQDLISMLNQTIFGFRYALREIILFFSRRFSHFWLNLSS